MGIVQRHILWELIRSTLATTAIVVGSFFVIAVALSMSQTRFEGVPFSIILSWTSYQVVSNLHLCIPLSILVACLFTFGRLASEGEYDALRTSGVHPWRVIAPALLLGAAACLALSLLQGDLMPDSRYVARRELAADVLRSLEGILRRDSALSSRGWKAAWSARAVDGSGSLILSGLDLLEFDKDGKVRSHTSARSARPWLDADADTLHLELVDLSRVESTGRFFSASNFTIDLPFATFEAARLPRREDSHRTYEELSAKWRRREEQAARATDPKARASLIEDGREAMTEFHSRVSFSASAFLFSLFGASLGLAMRVRHRALTFLIGFLLVVGAYYPLSMVGTGLGDRGVLPPALAPQLANAALLAGTFYCGRRLLLS